MPIKLADIYGQIGQHNQRAKKVLSDSLVDFAIGLVNFVLNLPDGQVKFFDDSNWNCEINSSHQNVFGAT